MKLSFCVACGTREGLEHHHLVPRSAGGCDDDANMITLCHTCHGKAHGVVRKDLGALTKAALAAAKARGAKLGGYREGSEDRCRGIAAQGSAVASKQARARAEDLRGVLEELEARGITSLRGIAKALNERKLPTPRGGTWAGPQVLNLKRLLDNPPTLRVL